VSGQISRLLNIPSGATVNVLSGFANPVRGQWQDHRQCRCRRSGGWSGAEFSGTVSNTGTMMVQAGGELVFAGVANGGTTQILDGGSVRIEKASSENVAFEELAVRSS
jgi:hypothetical protein